MPSLRPRPSRDFSPHAVWNSVMPLPKPTSEALLEQPPISLLTPSVPVSQRSLCPRHTGPSRALAHAKPAPASGLLTSCSLCSEQLFPNSHLTFSSTSLVSDEMSPSEETSIYKTGAPNSRPQALFISCPLLYSLSLRLSPPGIL